MLKLLDKRHFQYGIILALLLININCYAQSSKASDTIYYKVDTLKTPENDRMITSETAGNYKFYTIKCGCLKDGIYPIFRCNINKSEKLSNNISSHLNYVKLSQLILIVSKNDTKDFNDRFIIYFVEPDDNFLIKRRVFFQGGFITTVN